MFLEFKVQIFWEGHKLLKKSQTLFWCHCVISKKREIYSKILTFSQYLRCMKLFFSNTNTVTYCLFVHASTLWGSSTQSENEQYFHFCGELSRLIVHRCASPIIGQKMLKWKLSPLTSFNLVYVDGAIMYADSWLLTL